MTAIISTSPVSPSNVTAALEVRSERRRVSNSSLQTP
jgi:hypothetical protein